MNNYQFNLLERNLFEKDLVLFGFDCYENEQRLTNIESLIALLISNVINMKHVYRFSQRTFPSCNNTVDPIIAHGIHRIRTKYLKNFGNSGGNSGDKEKNDYVICKGDIRGILDAINAEYCDEGHISSIIYVGKLM